MSAVVFLPTLKFMIQHLKSGQSAAMKAESTLQVRNTVEAILADIAANGEKAVRQYSEKFDKWSPPSQRCTWAAPMKCTPSAPPRCIAATMAGWGAPSKGGAVAMMCLTPAAFA